MTEQKSLLDRQLESLGLSRGQPPDAAGWEAFLAALQTPGRTEPNSDSRSFGASPEAQLQAIAKAIPDLMFFMDEDGCCLEIFAAEGEGLCVSSEDAEGLLLQELLPRVIADRFLDKIQLAVAQHQLQVVEYQIELASGIRDFEARIAPVDFIEQGKRTLLVIVRDVTEAKATLAHSRLIGRVMHSAREGVVVMDENLRIISVNPAFEHIFMVAGERLVGQPFMISRTEGALEAHIWLQVAEHGGWQGEINMYRADAQPVPIWLTLDAVQGENGSTSNYVALMTDISDIRDSRQELEYLATHDSLTGLPNRVLFQERLHHAIQSSEKTGESGALLFFDLDRFKAVNDGLGHQFGDALLREVAKRMARVVREQDTMARLGGDEFTLIVEQVNDRKDAQKIARKMLACFVEPFLVEGFSIHITASIGLSLFPNDGKSVGQLIKNADSAMYSAKEEGRNQYRFFTEEMASAMYEHFSLEQDLTRGLQSGEFYVQYQPQFDLASGKYAGAEALLRWNSSTRGKVSPDDFIPMAEITGMINGLGQWVIEAVCQQVRAWLDSGVMCGRVAINLSRRQLIDRELAAHIFETLDKYDIDGSLLEIEITERAIIEQGDMAYRNLSALNDLGMVLAIDDFGTGHSSLVNLKRFPLHRLKIDRSFVDGVGHDHNDESIIRATIALGKSMGMRILAEGVETEAQLQFLTREGCDEVQGFLLGVPVNGDILPSYFDQSVASRLPHGNEKLD